MRKFILSTTLALFCSWGLVGKAQAVVSFGDGGAALQAVFDGITTNPAGNSSIDVNTDQANPDELWSIGGTGQSAATIVVELAAFAAGNNFGIYDATDSSKKVQVFAGSDAAGAQAVISIKLDGSVFLNVTTDTGVDFAGNLFGFYLEVTNTGNTWYSQTSLNSDALDHLAAYQGKGTDTIQLPLQAPGLWLTNEYALAFEDLEKSVSDKDYTDFVVMVESVNPVPEPSSLLLLGSGLVGLGLVARRRRQAQKA